MSALGYDNDGHLERIRELFDDAQSDLNAVGDATTCQKSLDAILRAKGAIGEAAGHIESLGAFLDPDVDAELSKRYQQLSDHYEKVRDSFGRLCVRRE